MLRKAQRIFQNFAIQVVEPIDRFAYKSYYDFPFGNTPRANAGKYLEIWKEAKSRQYPVIDEIEFNSGYSIDKDWFHDLALQTQVVIKKSDICYQHGRLLYSVLSGYISRNNYNNLTILETGTARGFSSLCMAKALNDIQKYGKIITIDVLPHDVPMYWNCIADTDRPKTRSEVLQNYQSLLEEFVIFIQGDSRLQLKKLSMPRVHFAFLDGAHTYEYILNEFNFIKDKQKKGDIIFFDDYTPHLFPGIVKAVDELCERHSYSKSIITIAEERGYVIAQKN